MNINNNPNDNWDEELLSVSSKQSKSVLGDHLPKDKSPDLYKSKLPTLPTGKNLLVPMAGLVLAVAILVGGQTIIPLVKIPSASDIKSSYATAFALVYVPGEFILNKSLEGLKTANTLVFDGLVVVSKGAESFSAGAENVGKNITPVLSDLSSSVVLLLNQPIEEQKTVVKSEVLNKPVKETKAIDILPTETYSNLATSVMAATSEAVNDLILFVGRLVSGAWEGLIDFKDFVINNWLSFLFGGEDEEATTEIIVNETSKESIATPGGNEAFVTENGKGQGLVVVPAGEGDTVDSVKQEISNLFSDPVNVRFDESGQAGIITPIFSDGPGKDYIFVLTPIDGN